MKVSVILPTYNEVDNIVELVRQIIHNIPLNLDHEIIVVDDNSPDHTFQVVQDAFQGQADIVPVLRTTDRGFAKSIRAGIEKATGDKILVMDTDFTHDPVEIPKLLHVGEVFDIVSGSNSARVGICKIFSIILPACYITGSCGLCFEPKCKTIWAATSRLARKNLSFCLLMEFFLAMGITFSVYYIMPRNRA